MLYLICIQRLSFRIQSHFYAHIIQNPCKCNYRFMQVHSDINTDKN
ncbi:hypothetical protein PRABACTJOHN_01235 [Parabacteroides johnsonii DSM 18315]|uniref:Uncharacterized protein n=1 Tax=Parabacteroides johnsonii DSM 18315 TaxID=537006 RepID=B7B885_9BACT|nr:hypothetical protein PRABACTJOHN_01235 [Parabacteroides johnsonii DSM 18315]